VIAEHLLRTRAQLCHHARVARPARRCGTISAPATADGAYRAVRSNRNRLSTAAACGGQSPLRAAPQGRPSMPWAQSAGAFWADSARARRASNAQASASNAASSSWSSGITTGSPKPVTPAALSAACAVCSAQCVGVVSTACDPVTSVDPACASSDRSWGASSRWFKSSRPDQLRPLIFLRGAPEVIEN